MTATAARVRGEAGPGVPDPPLAGALVVDLTRHLPGPLAARLLADLGARVVKVEEPSTGDPVRAAPPARDGRSALAALLLAGRESVALDLAEPAARRVLDGLLAEADVLLESFRPGTLARWGLAPERLAERHPRLVVGSLSGWGADGPSAHRAGHDLTYQAVAGALAPGAGVPAQPTADLLGAWSVALAVCSLLLRRERTGRGGRVDASLLDAAVHGNLVAWAEEEGGERRVGEPLGLTGALPCYRIYRTRDDRRLAVAALERPFWRRWCEAAGHVELIGDQYRREPEAHRRVAEVVAGRTAADWQRIAEEHDLPVEVVLSAGEARRHSQVRHRGVLGRGGDGLPRLAFPALIDGGRPAAEGGLPELGADTDRVVDEVGGGPARAGRRARRRAGIGRRWSWRRWLWRLVSSW